MVVEVVKCCLRVLIDSACLSHHLVVVFGRALCSVSHVPSPLNPQQTKAEKLVDALLRDVMRDTQQVLSKDAAQLQAKLEHLGAAQNQMNKEWADVQVSTCKVVGMQMQAALSSARCTDPVHFGVEPDGKHRRSRTSRQQQGPRSCQSKVRGHVVLLGGIVQHSGATPTQHRDGVQACSGCGRRHGGTLWVKMLV